MRGVPPMEPPQTNLRANLRAPGRVAAIVLAAGLSQRMGPLKMLLPFGDRPMVARTIENLVAAQHISPLIVVTGHAAQEIAAAVAIYKVVLAHNASYAAGGMLSSVQTGVRALPADCEAFLLVLGDQPMVSVNTLQSLQNGWQETEAACVLPTYGGRRGHPVLFRADCIPEILNLPAEATLKTVVTRHAADGLTVAVSDPAVLIDIDTPADYAAALQLWQNLQLCQNRTDSK